ncbi:MAG: hypothetical protein LBU36_03070 [Clostridiales bacterium]|jgi:YbbR domain-containing protein|nr:hypothetical protein [Clostridiales bacterium]
MIKRLAQALFKNLRWKLLSFVLAAALWFVCINFTNPIESKTFTSRLIVQNLDAVEHNGYVLLNKSELDNSFIRVSVKAERYALLGLSNDDFQPYIDVSPIDYLRENTLGADQPLNIYVNPVGNAAHSGLAQSGGITTQPLTVNIRLDRVASQDFPVTVNTSGSVAKSYSALPGSATPETVRVTGPTTVLKRIVSVAVEADITGVSSDVAETLALKVVDSDKRDITGLVTLNASSVEVKIPVNMYARIPIKQNYSGSPAEGYSVAGITRNVDYIEVLGAEEDISQVEEITLPDFDLSGLKSPQTLYYDVRPQFMQSRLNIVNGTPHEVSVTVDVAPLEKKSVTINMGDIRLTGMDADMGGDTVELPSEPFEITVIGSRDVISAFTSAEVKNMSIDVSGLSIGEHYLPLLADLPDGVKISGEPPMVRVVVHAKDGGGRDAQNNRRSE